MCHIKSPSSSITIEHIIENPSNGIFYSKFTFSTYSLHTIIHKISSRILRYAYQWTKSINISSLFANLQFKIVDYLQFIYRLKSDSSICTIQEEKSKYYRDIFH
ncbi:unnamed protein product [Rotaria sp. Silwood2]|nr:unnamed protein product [Rotaria sp. Silwood2]